MGAFVEKYVRTPLREVDMTYTNLQPISLEQTTPTLEIRIGDKHFTIPRFGLQLDLAEGDGMPAET